MFDKLKLHLSWYTKYQRNGVLFLLGVIILLQVVYISFDFNTKKPIDLDSLYVTKIKQQLDSLNKQKVKFKNDKIYLFNPNFISDYKGYKLGMTTIEIDRLHQYRKENKWINSKQDFQRVTKVSDSLLLKLAPYFKFPNWVNKKNKKSKLSAVGVVNKIEYNQFTTNDLNNATAKDLNLIKGVDYKLSRTIINYRKKLKGFYFKHQLNDVLGMNKEAFTNIFKKFRILTKPKIQKININEADFKEVLALPFIDYSLCKRIFDYRDEVAELQNIQELKNIEGISLSKFNIIQLYFNVE